jgi:hypothetical protein
MKQIMIFGKMYFIDTSVLEKITVKGLADGVLDISASFSYAPNNQFVSLVFAHAMKKYLEQLVKGTPYEGPLRAVNTLKGVMGIYEILSKVVPGKLGKFTGIVGGLTVFLVRYGKILDNPELKCQQLIIDINN